MVTASMTARRLRRRPISMEKTLEEFRRKGIEVTFSGPLTTSELIERIEQMGYVEVIEKEEPVRTRPAKSIVHTG